MGIHIAAELGFESVCLDLLNNCLLADPKDSFHETPLLLAAERRHMEVVKLLLGRDAVDPCSKDSWGRTPLSRAARQEHKEVVKLLLGRGDVDPNSKDSHG